ACEPASNLNSQAFNPAKSPQSSLPVLDIAESQVISKKILLTTIKDPDTVTFRNVVAVKEQSLFIFCGELNAKNSFGAFTGYQKFIATPLRSFSNDAPDFDSAWNAE